MYYTFFQNNSGGFFIGPAEIVIIEGDSIEEIIKIALDNDIYFDGVHLGKDCSCCGNRWETPNGDSVHWNRVPEIYGEPAHEYKSLSGEKKIKIIHKDGIEDIVAPAMTSDERKEYFNAING